MATTSPRLESCSIDTLVAATRGGPAHQVVDVREPGEYASEHIAGSCLVPLSSLEAAAREVPRDRDIYLVCQTGNRAADAAARLARLGYTRLHVVEGGLVAWVAAGHPVTRGERRVWALDRQVRFTAGSLVLVGALLALLAHPAFALLSAGVGAGLVFSAATNTCGMTHVLARMPWNRCGTRTRVRPTAAPASPDRA